MILRKKLISLCSIGFLVWLLQKHKTKLIFTLVVKHNLVSRLSNLISGGQVWKRQRKHSITVTLLKLFALVLLASTRGWSQPQKCWMCWAVLWGGEEEINGLENAVTAQNCNFVHPNKGWVLWQTQPGKKEGCGSADCEVVFFCTLLCAHTQRDQSSFFLPGREYVTACWPPVLAVLRSVVFTYKHLTALVFIPRAGRRLGAVVSGMRRTIAGSISCPPTPCR